MVLKLLQYSALANFSVNPDPFIALVIFKCTFRVLNLPRKYCILMVLLWFEFELYLRKILMLKSYPLITQNLSLFGKRVIANVIG